MFETTEVVEGAVPVYIRDGLEDCSFFWMKKLDNQHAEIVAYVPPLVGGRRAWFSIRDKFEKTNKFHFLEDDSLAESLLSASGDGVGDLSYVTNYAHVYGNVPCLSPDGRKAWIRVEIHKSAFFQGYVNEGNTREVREWEKARSFQNEIIRARAGRACLMGRWPEDY